MGTKYDIDCPVFAESGGMYVTSPFGTRKSPSNGQLSTHKGVDITRWNGYSTTATITAFADGTVTAVKTDIVGVDHTNSANSAGNYVTIKHDNGYVTKYFHLKYGSIVLRVGDRVKQGQRIGFMGNTGNSYGAHLHFQLELNGTPIDGLPFLLGNKTITQGGKTVNITLEVLKKGSKNDSVKALQILLNGLGYPCGQVDGSFGNKTYVAVKQFQTKNKLTADGSVGEKTWNALLK